MSDDLIVLGDDWYEEDELFADDNDEWYFEVYSELYGCDEHGSYETESLAEVGIKRMQAKVKELNDGKMRYYSAPYQGSGHKRWS